MIEVKRLSKAYGQREILHEVDLRLKKGRSLAITGKSGCGKSTLLNLIGLLERPDSGKILRSGEDIAVGSHRATKWIRYQLGYLFQNYALIEEDTVEENIRLAMKYRRDKADQRELLQESIERVGLAGLEKQKVYTLSGGEQQRVALARLFVKPCEYILADEPTGNLDDENSRRIMKLLLEFSKKGKALLVVTHDRRFLQYFDQAFLLEKGTLRELAGEKGKDGNPFHL